MAITTMAPSALVQGPTRIPIPYGLFSVLDLRGEGDGRWQTGATWESLACGPAGGIGGFSCDPENPTLGLPKTLETGNIISDASPFTIYGNFACSPLGWSPEAAQNRAEEHLLAYEEMRVEQAIWTGDLGSTPNFQEAAVNTGGATSPHAVLAVLSSFIRKHYGTAGILHVGPDGAAVLKAEHLISEKNGRWTTMFGDLVVIGFGYPEHAGGPTLGPAQGGWSWVVMTPPMLGYRSDIFTSSNRAGDLLDRDTNDLTAVAERTYLVGWDDECGGGIIAMQMALTASVNGGGGGLTQADLDAQTAEINETTNADRDAVQASIAASNTGVTTAITNQTGTLQGDIADASADIQANDDANTTTITDAIAGGGA